MRKDAQQQMASLLQSRTQSPATRQAEYAHLVISHILRRCGNKAVLKQAMARVRQSGEQLLTWDFFYKTFSDFPLELCSDALPGVKLHVDRKASFPRMMTTFSDVPFVRAFVERRDQQGDTTSLAMIFPRNLIQLGLIIHTGLPESIPCRYGTSLVHVVESVTVYVEPFALVLAAIHRGGHGWRAVL